jgi:LDH2 family malate/lactate/ureidoglycolate dehydrogenase
MDEILRMLKAAAPAPGVPRVLAAGEVEFANESRNRELGVPLPEEVVKQLVDLGNQVGADFPSLHPTCA